MPDADRHLILAVDVGSSAVKAAVIDVRGQVISMGASAQRTFGDEAGGREVDPARSWGAVTRSMLRALDAPGVATRIAAVSVTGPRGTFGVTTATGRALSRWMTWQDRRAASFTSDLASALDDDSYRSITGTSMDPSVVLPKLLWLRARAPGMFDRDWRLTSPQGDVLTRLGADRQVIDLSAAGHLGLLDVERLAWSPLLLDRYDIPRSAMPVLARPGDVVGRLAPSNAARFGMAPGIPLIVAGSDGICAELGAGVTDPGQLYAYLGTAAAVAGPLLAPDRPNDRSLILMPGSTTGRWRILGLGMAGGSARQWFMETHGIRDQLRVERLIGSSPPGARGTLFVPTLAGAAAPIPDGRARGVFAGLTMATTPADLARAVHEGVAMEMRWMIEAIGRSTIPPTELALTGGGSRSDGWSQILADVAGIPVARITEPNPGLIGAGTYALATLGVHPTVLSAARAVRVASDIFEPRLEHLRAYDEGAEMYALMRRSFHEGGLDDRLFRRTQPTDAHALG